MVCTECGSSVEFFSPDIERIEQEVGRANHYLTTRHTFQVYGICEACQKKSKRSELHRA
jgi:Fur family ferric uptake transcriptional regulator